jgi:hypothetical protein
MKNTKMKRALLAAVAAAGVAVSVAAPAEASTVTTGTVCLTTATTPGIYLEYWTGWSHEPMDAHYMYRGWCVKATGFGVYQGQYVKTQYGTVYDGGFGAPFFGDGWQPYSMHTTGTVRLTGHYT